MTAPQGWQCPRCERVYAPWVACCSVCGPGSDAEPSREVAEAPPHRYDPASVTAIETERAPSRDHDKRPPAVAARFGFAPHPPQSRAPERG